MIPLEILLKIIIILILIMIDDIINYQSSNLQRDQRAIHTAQHMHMSAHRLACHDSATDQHL